MTLAATPSVTMLQTLQNTSLVKKLQIVAIWPKNTPWILGYIGCDIGDLRDSLLSSTSGYTGGVGDGGVRVVDEEMQLLGGGIQFLGRNDHWSWFNVHVVFILVRFQSKL